MCHLINNNAHGPFLVACPLSVLSNWIKEFQKFAPLVPVSLGRGHTPSEMVLTRAFERKQVLMYHGTPAERAEIRETKMRPELLDIPLARKKPIPGGTGTIPVFPVVSRLWMTRTRLSGSHCMFIYRLSVRS